MISELIIKNFKCYTDNSFELNKLTILAGGNASGKSSVIQSILLLRNAYSNVNKKQLETNDILGINLGLPDSLIAKERNEDKIFIICNMDRKYLHEVNLELFDKEDNPMAFFISNCENIIKNNHKKEFDEMMFTYINAERVGPRVMSLISESKELYVGSNGEFTSYIMSRIDRVQRTDSFYDLGNSLNLSKIKRFSANCQEWLNVIIPDTEFDLSTLPEYGISGIMYKNSGDYYVPTATGFGITYVLPIIVQSLVNSLFTDSILVIENPEAHLHPYSQSQIGRFLAYVAASGVQVILETHSEHVINGCRLEMANLEKTDEMGIIYFERKGKEYNHKNITVNTYGELSEWPAGFFDQTKNDLKKLLEKRLCGE